MVKVAPSLLAADFRAMGAEIERMAAAGADYLQDVYKRQGLYRRRDRAHPAG